ncbi:MAG TPA: ABC transporter permease, partial [Gemmatimonadales bacterium]|nr:ABC transporter permease [Gemmatimonadales bacterium]
MVHRALSELGYRLRALFRRSAAERELDAELRFHLEQEAAKHVAAGVPREEAIRRARLAFGGVERIKDDARDARGLVWLDTLGQDLRYAVRGLRSRRAFTLGVVLTLGLGIGANATMFGIVDRLLLRLPDQGPHAQDIRRITVARMMDHGLSEPWDAISYPSFVDMRDQSSSFTHVVVLIPATMSFGLGRDARPVEAMLATGQYVPMLGTPALLGRMFDESEDRLPDGTPVVVLSYDFWRSAFGGRRDALGESVRIDGRVFEVIGVAPEGFSGTNLEPVDLW